MAGGNHPRRGGARKAKKRAISRNIQPPEHAQASSGPQPSAGSSSDAALEDYIENSFSEMGILDNQQPALPQQLIAFANRELDANPTFFESDSDLDTSDMDGVVAEALLEELATDSSSLDDLPDSSASTEGADEDAMDQAFQRCEDRLLGNSSSDPEAELLHEEDIVYQGQADQQVSAAVAVDGSNQELTQSLQSFLDREKTARKTGKPNQGKSSSFQAVEQFRTRPLNQRQKAPLLERDWMDKIEAELVTATGSGRKSRKQLRAKQLKNEIDFARSQMSPKSQKALSRVERKTSGTLGERAKCEKAVRAVLRFAEDGVTEKIIFVPLSDKSRSVLHKVAHCSGLKSESVGVGRNRRPTIYRSGKHRVIKEDQAMRFVIEAFGVDSSSGQDQGSLMRSLKARPLDESNEGHKLLTKMGWSAGTGLGVDREGRQDPVAVTIRSGRQGLS